MINPAIIFILNGFSSKIKLTSILMTLQNHECKTLRLIFKKMFLSTNVMLNLIK